MSETITLDGDPITLAYALANYIRQEQKGETEYLEKGDTEYAAICTRSIKRAAELQEQISRHLGYCHSAGRPGCFDPLPHTICEI
jgi:hypothetical protein